MPSPGETVELVVIGGGPSGLFAAHRLNDRDVVVLEKEPETGGNCRYDEWQGVRMSTGGAFYTASETSLVELLAEIGAPGMPVEGPDALVIHGQPTKDFFRDGAKQLPFPVPVQDDFRRSRDDLLKLYKTKKAEELDVVSFAELLKPYAPEVRQFWDSFGQSNWGGTAENTSGYVGAEAYTWAGAADDPRFTYPGGMSGAAVKLSEVVRKQLGSRLRTNTAAYSVDVEGSGKKSTAVVRYFEVLGA
jgi:monoamine oxidase